MFKKLQTMKISDYVEVVKNEYVTYQVIPAKSNRNHNTDGIASIINKMYLKVNQMIIRENKKLIISTQMKASYYIHITKDKVEFYFIVPAIHKTKFKTKFIEVWKNVEVKEVDKIPLEPNKGTKYQLNYKHNDILSLDVDKRSNDLLNANLSTLEIMETGESIGIFYNFIPTDERQINYFHVKHGEILAKYKNGYNLKKNKNIADLLVLALRFLIGFVDDFITTMQNNIKSNDKALVGIKKEPTNATMKKASKEIIKTQIIITSQSTSKDREKALINSLSNSFKSISNDNELVSKEIKKDIDIYKTCIENVGVNYTTVEETQNFISLAGKELIEQYNIIDHNKILELKIPKSLENGDIRIGTVKCKDTVQEAYYSTDKQISRLGRILMGSMGAGKDYYMVNMAKDIIKAGRGLIVIDYIDTCQLSENIKAITPKDRLIEIDCSNINQLQSFSYNELQINDNADNYNKISIAMQKAQQLQILLDSINDDNSKLTPRMLRYLYAGATVVFYNNFNASFKNVIDILLDPYKRENLIDSMGQEAKDLLTDEIDDLKELTKADKKGNLENADTKIDGIIDRISWLKTNFYTKLAFTKESVKNIDFVEAINQNKIILIKIPEKTFNSKMIRNVLATFYLSKIWLSKQLGATETKTELFINEIHQSYNMQLLMEDILVECRKFNLVPTLALHYLGQCTNKLKNSILASGSSFLLLAGCDVKAYTELKAHFDKYGYSEADLVELERYTALCLIKNEETNYCAFVSKLPA
jgi:hypothetical protein